MADGGLTIFNGQQIRVADLSLPESDVTFTGARLLDVADSKVSSLLSGLSLPDSVKSSALKRVNVGDVDGFRCAELDRQEASSKFKDYVIAIADELEGIALMLCLIDEKIEEMTENFWIRGNLFSFFFSSEEKKESGRVSVTALFDLV